MELKVSILEYLYQKSPYCIKKIMGKLRALFGYKYCVGYRHRGEHGGYFINGYPRSLEEAELYVSYYIEYWNYKDVEILDVKKLKSW